MKCVATGCALIWEGAWVAGDLFDVGTHYVFNGNYDHDDEAGDGIQWIVGEPFYANRISPSDYWERRGVFVVDKAKANPSEALVEYIGGRS